MAYVEPDKKEDEVAGGTSEATGPEAGSATLGGAEGGGATESNAAQASEPSSASSGAPQGQFVGIKQYLDANKNQSQQLANNLGGYVNELGDNARKDLTTQTGNYNKAVDDNTVNLNNDLVEKTKYDKAATANNAQNLADFQKMRDANYAGPTSFETSDYYQPAQQSLTKAQTAADNTQTEQGQRNLINTYQQDKTGRIGSAGTTNFDQMLLQSGGGKETLGQAREAQKDLGGLFANASTAAAEKAKQAAATTQNTRDTIQNVFGQGGTYGQGTIEKLAQERAQSQINQSNERAGALANLMKSGGPISEADLKDLGISQKDYEGLVSQMQAVKNANMANSGGQGFDTAGNPWQDLSAANFYSRSSPAAQISAQTAVSPEEIAQYQALNQLMGTNNNYFSNPSLAGTSNLDSIDFNLGNAQSYLTDLLAKANAARPATAQAGYVDEGKTSNFQTAKDAALGGALGAATGMPQGALPGAAAGMATNVSNKLKIKSDKNEKKDVKPFKASEFLDSLITKNR